VPLINPTGKRKVLPAIHPNAGVTADYRRRLDDLIAEMHCSVMFWLKAQYRRKPPHMAADASPANELEDEMRRLGDRWQRRFDMAAEELARHFAKAAGQRADGAFTGALKRAGMTVRFRMSKTVQDITTAAVNANVMLIKTIPRQYLAQVQGAVMRSVQQGGDLKTLTDFIEGQYGITRRRAEFIARDQNSKATAAVTRARQEELGLFQAKFLHSHGGRQPRIEHVEFSRGTHRTGGPYYDVRKGAYLEGVWTWPGVQPQCKCVSAPVVEGLT
jgi:uncharacterized protein with gpF-like domain